MNVPAHYVSTIRSLIRFAAVLTCIGLLSGLVLREAGRMLPASLPLAPGERVAALLSANLSHGHIFSLGVFVPAALIVFMVAAKLCGARDIRERSLQISLAMYRVGVVAALLLQLYKGLHTEILVSRASKQDDFAGLTSQEMLAVDAALFLGNKWLRMGLYGVSHLLLGSGLSMWMVSLARSLNQPSKQE